MKNISPKNWVVSQCHVTLLDLFICPDSPNTGKAYIPIFRIIDKAIATPTLRFVKILNKKDYD